MSIRKAMHEGEELMRKFLGLCAALAFALVIGLSNSAGAKVGASCGGFVGPITCSDKEFCQMRTGVCWAPNAIGRCVAVPDKCNKAIFPVCGCNHMTYNNDCERKMARVSKLHDGKC
jgi:hypothetical protein